jgi:hypothetical protein
MTDPRRGYAAWLIATNQSCNLHTWNAWLKRCARLKAAA